MKRLGRLFCDRRWELLTLYLVLEARIYEFYAGSPTLVASGRLSFNDLQKVIW